VNAFAIFVVNDHIQSLQLEAARHRAAAEENRPSLRTRIASAGTNLRRTLGLTGEPDYSFLPKIQDYPYRG